MRHRQKIWFDPRRAIMLVIVAAGCLSGSGCALIRFNTPVRPPLGAIFTDIKAPLTVAFNRTPAGEATRTVSHSEILFVHDILLTGMSIGWDDAAIARIARDGGLESVAYADYEFFQVFGVYAKFTVYVHGN